MTKRVRRVRHGVLGAIGGVLALAVEGGRARLTRRRAADARSRDADDVWLELPGAEGLRGEEVDDWLSWNHLPDWDAWKRSFCQHQELSRARVTEPADRSAAIAGMLGLDAYRKVSDELKKLEALQRASTRWRDSRATSRRARPWPAPSRRSAPRSA